MRNSTRNGSPSYLIQAPYGYHFRFKIPKDPKPHLDNKQELRYSLKTGSICEAKERARLLAGKIQKLFRKPKTEGNFMSSDFSENKVYSLIREYLTEVLEDDEKVRVMSDVPVPYKVHKEQVSEYDSTTEIFKMQLALGDYSSSMTV